MSENGKRIWRKLRYHLSRTLRSTSLCWRKINGRQKIQNQRKKCLQTAKKSKKTSEKREIGKQQCNVAAQSSPPWPQPYPLCFFPFKIPIEKIKFKKTISKKTKRENQPENGPCVWGRKSITNGRTICYKQTIYTTQPDRPLLSSVRSWSMLRASIHTESGPEQLSSCSEE